MIQVQGTELRLLNAHTRMPFRYGIATMTALPHLFVRVELAVEGQIGWGVAADHLPPKWFTKNPQTPFRHDIDEMLAVVQSACGLAQEMDGAETPFELWQGLYQAQKAWAEEQDYPPLLWGFGVSLVERATIDAFCRIRALSFGQAVHTNALGIQLGQIHGELAGRSPADFLPAQPLQQIIVRHTVGLSDPLTDAEIPEPERLQDGLPQSLQASIQAYGLTHFKIKIGGDIAADLDRLRHIAAVVLANTRDYQLTLDGNESYRSVADFRTLWEGLMADPAMGAFVQSGLIFVEQPLHRDVALSAPAREALLAWRERPPIIIDESDAEVDSVRIALDSGYAGTSHKNCKGVFKGIANTCLVRHRAQQKPDRPFRMSGEDLSNIGPVALLQDLAVLGTLGIDHAERNGHHYFAGLSFLPREMQARILDRHGDLYRAHGDMIAVRVHAGHVQIDSLNQAPFGYNFDLDLSPFIPLAQWRFEDLGLAS